MKVFDKTTKYADLCADVFKNAYMYEENLREKERKEFLSLLLDDEVIKNNRALQEKYMELYDKYIRR